MMDRDELISEISMRCDIPYEDVEEVLDEEDLIFVECERKRKKKRRIITFFVLVAAIAGAVAAIKFLDSEEKISISDIQDMVKENVAKYMDKIKSNERA